MWPSGAPRHFLMAILFCGLFPLGVFLHECGHYFTAQILGWEARLTPTYVPFVAPKLTSVTHILFQLGGISVDLVLVGIGIVCLQHTRNRDRPNWLVWVATALTMFAVRWWLAPLFLAVGMSDEAKISIELGMPPWVVPALSMPPGLVVLVFVLKIHLRNKTIFPLIAGCISLVLGMGLWVNIIGPWVLR